MGTLNEDILPANSGLNLGSSSQPWNGSFQNLTVLGTLTSPSGITGGSSIIILASSETGADAGTKIAAAVTALPSTGGAVYCDLTGAQTIATDVFTGITKAVHFVFFSGNYTFTLGATIPTTCAVTVMKGATLLPAAGKTLTINGSFEAGLYTVFGGSGTSKVMRPRNVIPVQWYGAIGDGVTDDYAAINACITANPGRTIYFPKTQASSSGGGGATNIDYYCSQGLTMSGNGQRLMGDPDAYWSGGSCIKFAAATNPLILIPANCYAAGLDHLELRGQDAAVGAANGVEIRGGYCFVRYCHIGSVGGNGVWINGAGGSGYLADGWEVSYSDIAGFTRGLYAQGTDANVGLAMHNTIACGTGGTAGIENNANFVNWYIANHLEGGPASAPVILDTSGNGYWSNYVEGGQGAEVYKGTESRVISGWHGSGIDHTNSQFPVVEGGSDVGITGGLNLGSRTYIELYNRKDAIQSVYTRSGLTANYGNKCPIFRKYDNSGDFSSLYFLPGSPNSFGIYDEVNGFFRIRAYVPAGAGACSTEVNSIGNGNVLLNYVNGSGTGGTLFGDGAGNVKASVNSSGKLSMYNAISTVSNGVPSEYATVDLTAQAAAITPTTLYTPTASGMFRISWVATVTQAGAVSSTLGGTNGFQIVYTDANDSVAKTTPVSATSTANTTATQISGCIVVYAKSATAIQYQIGYTDGGGGTAMQYDLNIKCEAL